MIYPSLSRCPAVLWVDAVDRIQAAGRQAIVLEKVRSSQIRKAYCTTDKVSAVKLARVYLSGMATEVWKPDERTRQRREVFYAYVAAMRDVGVGVRDGPILCD